MNRLLVVASLCLGVQSAVALEATWVNEKVTPYENLTYTTPENWTERSTGAAAGVAPTNAGDVAWFDGSTNGPQRIVLADIQTRNGVNHMGTLHGSWCPYLLTYDDSTNGRRYHTYLFDDLNDFQGILYPRRTDATFAFSGKTADVHVADLSTGFAPAISAPAGTVVTVDARHEAGAVKTAGDGTVKLAESAVPDSQIVYHNSGKLELVGHPDGVVSVPGDPVFWVDGSKTSTMDLAEADENGRRFINAWHDCRAADGVHTFSATPINNEYVSRPWVSAETQNGLATVNFGCYWYNKTADEPDIYGPQASLGYDFKANAREYFVVWRDAKDDAYTTSFVIGQTGAYDFHRGESNGQLFGSASTRARQGLIRLDGGTVKHYEVAALGRFHLLNVCLQGDGLKPTTFFNDRTTCRIGGGRLAEALFYTNVLTQAERTQVERYLQEKWFGQASDAEVIRTASAATPVSVPAGNVAKVRQVVVDGTAFVKEGAGVLKVGRFQPESPTIDVAGGAVAFNADQPTVATDAPAANAIVWLDATKEDTLSLTSANGTNFVTKWSDCRAGQTGYASAMSNWNNPFVSSDSCNGLRVIDFGEKDNAGTKAAMQLSCGDSAIVEAFQVVKLPVKNSNQNIFGSSQQALLRENTATLLHRDYAYRAPSAGLWTMNGTVVEPYADYPIDPGTWYVASFSADERQNTGCGYLAYDRGIKIGDQRIGEFIGYDRRLTDAERRQTIAYLMKKWKDADYAYAKAPAAIGQMNFTAENDAPKIIADVDTEIASVSFAGQTSLVKTGAGALTIDSSIPYTISDFSVEGACTVKGPISPFPDAAFHVDAMRADTFTFAADPEDQNRIDKWYDCRGNGLYAQSSIEMFGGEMTTNAVLASTGASGEGGLLANLPYVDFGTNAGMFWHTADGNQMTLANTREYHVVFCVTSSGNHQPISGNLGPGTSSLCPHGNVDQMFWGSCENAIGAAKRTDGGAWYTGNRWNEQNNSMISTTTFYVQSFQAAGDVSAYSFAIDRGNCGRGCVKLCEALVFTGATNTTERANAIHAYLLNKWKGVGENPITIDLNQVMVAAGGSLSLTSSVPLSVVRVTGGGELKFRGGSVRNLASVAASIDATGAVEGMTVDGSVSFAQHVAVSVTVADPKALNGVYTIFSADAFANAEEVTFDLTVDNPGARQFILRRDGAALKLQVSQKGTLFCVR